jgi:hypothetical protein
MAASSSTYPFMRWPSTESYALSAAGVGHASSVEAGCVEILPRGRRAAPDSSWPMVCEIATTTITATKENCAIHLLAITSS